MQTTTATNIWCGFLTIVTAVLAWQAWRALARKGQRQDVSLKRSLDAQAAAVAARWLSTRMNISEAMAIEGLNTSDATSDVAAFWREHEVQLHLAFEEVVRGTYQVTFLVSAKGDDRMEQTRSISLDELPDSVRSAFMRGNSSLEVHWTPTFEPGS
jgi:hypothetical protein